MKKALLFLLLSVISAVAQVTVQGNLQQLTGYSAGVRDGFVRFRLQNYGANVPRVPGIGIVQVQQDVKVDKNGFFRIVVPGNDQISPLTCGSTHDQPCTTYLVQAFVTDSPIQGPAVTFQFLTSQTQPIDISTAPQFANPPPPPALIPFSQLTPTLPCAPGQVEVWGGTQWSCSSAAGGGSATLILANAGSPGTTVNTLTKITGNPSSAVIASAGDTGGVVGLTTSGSGVSGNATITYAGSVNCIFDGATVAGDYVQISSTVAGNCHDSGSGYPTTGQVIGRVLSTNGGAGTYGMDLFPDELRAAAAAGGVTSVGLALPVSVFSISNSPVSTSGTLTGTFVNFPANTVLGNNTGSPATPSPVQVKTTNLADFNSTTPTTSGKIPIWDQPSQTYIPGDPFVQGTQAAGSTTQPNPVMGGIWDGTTLRALAGDSSGRQTVNVNGTVPVSAVSLPLPSGASTSAKQPALGTAGSASADVITIQGIAGMTAVKVDGSGVTQPVSGTFWQATQPVSSTQLPAALDGSGFLKVHEQGTPSVAQSGTWTMQPGNTANTTPWLATINQGGNSATVSAGGALKVDGSAVTQPISAADTTTGSTTLGALNDAISVSLAGQRGVMFQLQAAGTATYTVSVECSFDSGTTWGFGSGTLYNALSWGQLGSSVGINSGAATTPYFAECAPSASHVRLRVSSYTSGTANWLARATTNQGPPLAFGIVTTNAPSPSPATAAPLSLDALGLLRVSLKDSPQNTNAFKVDGSAVTQPVSGTVTSNIGITNGLALDATLTSMRAASTQNVASPAQALLTLGQFNPTPTTLTTGNVSPIQLDAAGNVLVNIKAGGGTGGGPADVGLTTAASETDAARQKVTAALRVLDTAQSAGSQLVGLKGDATSGLWVNVKAGGSTAGDQTASNTISSGSGVNSSTVVQLTGDAKATFQLTAAGTLIAVMTPQCSFDGGTNYPVNGVIQNATSGQISLNAVITSGQAITVYPVVCPQGASHVQFKATTFTSGSATISGRATVNTGPNLIQAQVNNNAPTYTDSTTNNLSITTAGSLRVEPSFQNTTLADALSNNEFLPATSGSGVVVYSPTLNHVYNGTTWDRMREGTTAGSVKVDGSAVTQPVSGTVTVNAGTNLNTSSLALDTTVAGLEVAQGSTTSGQKGALIQAAVTTAAPSYTTAQTSPLSLTPAGRLRIDGSGTTQPISGSVDQGSPNIGSPWLVRLTDGAVNTPMMDAPSRAAFQKITDGTNTAAVKAASTGAAAADPSLVVQISPNQAAFPVTANAGTNLNTSALALESGGNLATVASAVRAEDSVSADADKGIGALAIRKATPANTSSADGDYEYLQINGGRLWTSTVIDTALPAGSAIIGKVTTDQTTHGTTDLVADDITKVGGAALSLGSKTSANSIPVVIASDQGAFTVNIGTAGSLALDATLTGGTAKSIVRGGAKGSTSAADVTSTASGANHQIIDVGIYDAAGNQITTFGGGTQYADGTTQATPTGTVAMGKDPSNVIKSFALDASGRLITACGTGCSASSGGLLGTPLYVQTQNPSNTSGAKPSLAAIQANLTAGVYSPTPPVLTGGQQVALQVDRFGRLITAPPASLPPVKITVDGNATVGSPTQPLYTATVPATQPPSYHATTGATGFAAASAATDIFTIGGSSTAGVAILVTRLQVSCTQTTAGIIGLQVIKRSTADTAGTNITETPDDSKFGASGATVAQYTANPTVGTAVGGGVDSVQMGCLAAGTAAANDVYLNILPKPIVLRGTTEQLAINLNGQTLTGNKFTITVEYMAVSGI